MTDAPKWREPHREIVGPEIGEGFTKWDKPGSFIRGKVTHYWQGPKMRTPAVTLQLTETPTVQVVRTEDDDSMTVLEPQSGDLVNLGLTVDLFRKVTKDLLGEEVGIIYTADVETAGGVMRQFKVMHFEQVEMRV